METICFTLPAIEAVTFAIQVAEFEESIPKDFEEGTRNQIEEKIDAGDTWAWAEVTVVAKYKGQYGYDSMGGCSYKDEQAFIDNSGYWTQMKAAAYADLIEVLKELAD